MKLLIYALNLDKFEIQNYSLYNTSEDGFLELLLIQLINHIETILSRGLYRDYIVANDELRLLRGKIDFNQFCKKHYHSKDTLPCSYHLRSENNILNQVLLSGMNAVVFLTDNLRIRNSILDLIKIFKEKVHMVRITSNFVNKSLSNITRLTEHYRPALNLIKIIATPPDFVDEYSNIEYKLFGFFFDMNHFFQNLLLHFFNDTIGSDFVESEISIDNMYNYIANPFKLNPPKLRPDYLILDHNEKYIVLDAKYRDLSIKHLPSKWLYQLSMYALSGINISNQHNYSIILYPTNNLNIKDAKLQVNIPTLKTKLKKAYVVMRPIVWNVLYDYITRMNDPEVRNEAKKFANAIIDQEAIENYYSKIRRLKN